MKRSLLLTITLLVPLASLHADQLRLKDGQILQGEILATDGRTLTFRQKIGAGQAEIPFPLDKIKEMEFSNSEEERQLLASTQASDLPAVLQRWEKRKPFLSIKGSDSGTWALQAVRLALLRRTQKAAREAIPWAAEVEKADWSEERRREATRLRLSALAGAGRVEQALAEAETMQDMQGADEQALASARVMARVAQAALSAEKLKQLEKDWPKWDQMPEMTREHNRLLNEALDGYLFGAVFHPELISQAAEGLWKAAELAEKQGRGSESRAWLEDLIKWFPDPLYKNQAEEKLRTINKPAPSSQPQKSS